MLESLAEDDSFRMQVAKVRAEVRRASVGDARQAVLLMIEDHDRELSAAARLTACEQLLSLDPLREERAVAVNEIKVIAGRLDPLAHPDDVRRAEWLLGGLRTD